MKTLNKRGEKCSRETETAAKRTKKDFKLAITDMFKDFKEKIDIKSDQIGNSNRKMEKQIF